MRHFLFPDRQLRIPVDVSILDRVVRKRILQNNIVRKVTSQGAHDETIAHDGKGNTRNSGTSTEHCRQFRTSVQPVS